MSANLSPIIVCGLPRCGSSLTLQMLDAAGIPCDGGYPIFEGERGAEAPTADYVAAWQHGAFKLLDPHLIPLPTGFKYRFIFLTRSRKQQALSHLKFLRMIGQITGKIDDGHFSRIEDSLRQDEAEGFAAIGLHEGSILKVRFEDLVARTESAVSRIAWFLNLDRTQEAAMAQCVRPRSVSCYPGMLELELMDERKASEEGIQ